MNPVLRAVVRSISDQPAKMLLVQRDNLFEHLAAASAPGGVIIEHGRLSGQPTPFPVVPVIGKGLTLRGYTLSEILRNPQPAAEAKQYVYSRVADGRFVPRVAATFPLEQTVDAYRYLESNRQIGRVVITVP